MKVGTFGMFVVCAQATSGRDGKWLPMFRIDRQTPDLLRTDVVELNQRCDGPAFDTEVQAVHAAFEAGLIRLRYWQQGSEADDDPVSPQSLSLSFDVLRTASAQGREAATVPMSGRA
jgi:hypothetical protein